MFILEFIVESVRDFIFELISVLIQFLTYYAGFFLYKILFQPQGLTFGKPFFFSGKTIDDISYDISVKKIYHWGILFRALLTAVVTGLLIL